MTGSLGTLGLIAEVVLRTNPAPPVQRWVRGEHVDPRDLRDAVLRPGAVLWDGTSSWVLVEGHGADVDAEIARLATRAEITSVDGPPELPPYRWRLSPADSARADRLTEGEFVASIGVGTVWATTAPPAREPDPVAMQVTARMKQLFDPSGRLNPGRSSWT